MDMEQSTGINNMAYINDNPLEAQLADNSVVASQISAELVTGYKGVYNRIVKRALDVVLAVVLLVCLLPLYLLIAVAIVVDDGFPIAYRAKRGGYKERTFYICKFRSMVSNADKIGGGTTAQNDKRITRVGRVIRKLKLDEILNIINILKGEMSFIGPRPWIPEYYVWFDDNQKRRVDVLPGISGLAQVKGRNGINIFKKIDYDLQYVDNISIKQDLKIIFETIATVFSKSNAEITEDGIKEEISELKESKEMSKVG